MSALTLAEAERCLATRGEPISHDECLLIVAELARLRAAGPSFDQALVMLAKQTVGSPTWPHVLAFAHRMEAKLEANRHKGNREGWLKDSTFALFRRLRDESDELAEALRCESGAEVIANEAADVANFAMMIADVAGVLCPCDPENGPPESEADSCGKCVRGGG